MMACEARNLGKAGTCGTVTSQTAHRLLLAAVLALGIPAVADSQTLTASPTTIGADRDTDVTFSFSGFTAGASVTLGVASSCTALSFPNTNAAVDHRQ